MARDRAQELKAPNLELVVLQTIEDVTARVNAGVKPGMSSADTLAARRAAISAIEEEAEKKTGLQSEMVTLYQGAQYHLYLYKKFTDVRLVFAPEFDAAFFGGDPDNFTFPRYCLDMAIFRVYENGKPLQVKNFLPWSTAGAKEGEPVFTSGHPGTTQRLNTLAHLEYLRDQSLPFNIDAYGRLRDALDAYAKQGRRAGAAGQGSVLRPRELAQVVEGAAGRPEGSGAHRRRSARPKKSLRSAVMAKADLKAQYGDAWDRRRQGAARRCRPTTSSA